MLRQVTGKDQKVVREEASIVAAKRDSKDKEGKAGTTADSGTGTGNGSRAAGKDFAQRPPRKPGRRVLNMFGWVMLGCLVVCPAPPLCVLCPHY
eukprot:1300448-Rhodomonas_salina.2